MGKKERTGRVIPLPSTPIEASGGVAPRELKDTLPEHVEKPRIFSPHHPIGIYAQWRVRERLVRHNS